MPVMKKITEQEYSAPINNKKSAIEVYGMINTTECKCIFSAPNPLIKHFTKVMEWLMFVPDALNIEFDHIAALLANTMPKRQYYTVYDETRKGYVIGIPFARA